MIKWHFSSVKLLTSSSISINFLKKVRAKYLVEPLDEEHWDNFLLMRMSRGTLWTVKASVMLEGALYPTSSSVIPFLDTVVVQLKKTKNRVKIGDQREYVETFLYNLQAKNRFPSTMKTFIYTLPDPRYGDLFFPELERQIAVNDLIMDPMMISQSLTSKSKLLHLLLHQHL